MPMSLTFTASFFLLLTEPLGCYQIFIRPLTTFQHAGLHLDLRELNMVRLVRDKRSSTGLAAVLGPGGTWGDVLKVIPPER